MASVARRYREFVGRREKKKKKKKKGDMRLSVERLISKRV